MGDFLNAALTLPCGAVLKNRIAKAAMTEGLADAHNKPTQSHQNLYRHWSIGGAGLLITGNVMVDRRYLEHPGNVAIEDNSAEKELTLWAQAGEKGVITSGCNLATPGGRRRRLLPLSQWHRQRCLCTHLAKRPDARER